MGNCISIDDSDDDQSHNNPTTRTANNNYRPTTAHENQNSIKVSSLLTVNSDGNTNRLIGKLGNQQQVVVKIFNDKNSMNKQVAFLAKLKHPNILQLLFQCESDTQQLLMITENYDFALSDIQNPEEISGVMEAMTHLTKAVQYLQTKRIAHLDIAPENIAIEKYASGLNFKLTNFEYARVISNISIKNVAYNQKNIENAYTPPELRNKSEAILTSDCWSLGRVLLLLTCGDTRVASKSLGKTRTKRNFVDPYDINFNKLKNINSKKNALRKNLISKILIIDERKRISASKMLEHPFFWSAKDTLYFIVDVSKLIEASNAFRTEIFKGYRKVMGEDWTKRIPGELTAELLSVKQNYSAKFGGKQDTIDGTKIKSLIQTIRNHIVHPNNSAIEKIVGNTEEDFLNYWTQKFPFLIEHLFETKSRFENP